MSKILIMEKENFTMQLYNMIMMLSVPNRNENKLPDTFITFYSVWSMRENPNPFFILLAKVLMQDCIRLQRKGFLIFSLELIFKICHLRKYLVKNSSVSGKYFFLTQNGHLCKWHPFMEVFRSQKCAIGRIDSSRPAWSMQQVLEKPGQYSKRKQAQEASHLKIIVPEIHTGLQYQRYIQIEYNRFSTKAKEISFLLEMNQK